jgi:hypothetical protein
MAKRRRRKRAAAGAAKVGRRGRGRPRALESFSMTDLQAEIDRRAHVLMQRRAELQADLDAIDREIGGSPAPRRRGRPPGRPGRRPGRPAGAATAKKKSKRVAKKPANGRRRRGRGGNTRSLVESLHEVLAGRTMSVTEVSDAVQKAGYKTASPNFRTIVNQALLANSDRFKKVARGQYTSK